MKLFKGEKFDDIKFGKVLTKLYARMFTMEKVKYLPPKFSYALKDLADFLGIFEITDEMISSRKSEVSDTSSNLSYMTSSAFKPKSQLDVIREHTTYKEEDDEGDGNEAKQGETFSDDGKLIGKRALTGSNKVVVQKPEHFSNKTSF